MAESGRLALTVLAQPISPAPTATYTTATKITAVALSVQFALTSTHDANAVWRVYDVATGGTVVTGITATFTAPYLTLTHATDIPAGYYWVSVQEPNMAESDRLALTVREYRAPEEVIVTITFGGLPTDPIEIAIPGTGPLTVSQQPGNQLVISVNNPENYTSFRWWLNGVPLAGQIGSSFTIFGSELSAGLHQLTLIAEKDGVPFSAWLSFTVTN